MNLISESELRAFSTTQADPCVTIFMPTHRAGLDAQQDPIRLKNLLREAEVKLTEQGRRAPDIQQLLAPAQDLLARDDLWLERGEGLAIFLAPEFSRHYHVPLNLNERLHIGERFRIKPLLSLLSRGGQFYVLALSQNQVRLLQGTADSISPVNLDGVPKSLEEALKYDDPEKQLQSHTAASAPGAAGGDRSAMFYGHNPSDEAKDNIRRYLREVDTGLQKLWGADHAPVVLAGVDYMVAFYREVSRSKNLVEGEITGNVEEVNDKELHAKALEILKPLFEKDREQAAEKFNILVGKGQASGDVAQVAPAAQMGRVESLLVAAGRMQWGTFDPETNLVRLHQAAEPGDEDLLDLAAVQTHLNGGAVYVVEPDGVPGNGLLAAVYRY